MKALGWLTSFTLPFFMINMLALGIAYIFNFDLGFLTGQLIACIWVFWGLREYRYFMNIVSFGKETPETKATPIELPLTADGIRKAHSEHIPITLFGKTYAIWSYELRRYPDGSALTEVGLTLIDEVSYYQHGYEVVIKEYYDGSISVDLERVCKS
ncbi:hypothetical protein [Listeria newyorkensis]|uniref:Uncharacterized protein n=1 Tax=Listeria newyorkensis TaxID=1497681 RepID=A0A841YSL3_9LIST|nr:hypothetical protein [Listeria newyorkensis]MBC1456268.1 hypothetical protein [Listeria newyorkensis]